MSFFKSITDGIDALKKFPSYALDRTFQYIKSESRWWVLFMFFVMILSINFREAVIKYWFDPDPIRNQVVVSTKVNERLEHLLEGTHGSRVYIFQFHNGVTYYTGQHAQRFTCTYEIVSEGISREADNLQNLQVSIFAWWIDETLGGRMLYKDIQTMPDYTTKVMLEQQGVESIVCLPLISQGRVIGIVGVDYVGKKNPFLDGLVLSEWMQDEANKIADLLADK